MLCLSLTAYAQADYEYRYWFDTDYGTVCTGQTAAEQWRLDVDLDGVGLGFHTLHVQVKDTAQRWSAPVARYFLKTPTDRRLTCRCSYVFDDEQQARPLEGWEKGVTLIDVDDLDDGFHFIRFLMDNGVETSLHTEMFIKIPSTEGVDYMTCLATVDNQPYKQERLPTAGGTVKWNLDVLALEPGLHQLQAIVSTPKGATAFSSSLFFFRSDADNERGAMKCYYSIDGGETYARSGDTGNGTFRFDIDVASLENGLHHITYFLADEKGNAMGLNNAWFIKAPVGDGGLVRYAYWQNDAVDKTRSVELKAPVDSYDLIALLPVETCPLRSSNFRFVYDAEQPVIYANNELHVHFYDGAGRFVSLTRSYMDDKVSRKVTDALPLVSGKRHEKPCPQADEIYWFTLRAQTGDSLTFRTSQAATLQVFAPGGEEVYKASGTSSVNFGGCHAYQDGIYYVALHDVTGTNGTTIGLDYEHIDKYAVLEVTPESFGVPSNVNISLVGNGFTDNTRVALCRDDSVYWAQNVSAVSLSELTANFDCEKVPTGRYDLRVCYTDADSLVLADRITVEPADSTTDIDIALEGNPFFRAGGTATYTIRITNRSNIPVFCLPFTLAIECEGDEKNVPYLKFADDVGKETREELKQYLSVDMDEVTVNQILHYLYGKDNDLSMFYVDRDSITGCVYRVGHFVYPRIDAHASVTIPFTLRKMNHDITIYASTKKHWSQWNHVKRPDSGTAPGEGGNTGPGSGESEGTVGPGQGSGGVSGGGSGSTGTKPGDGNDGDGGKGDDGSDDCCIGTAVDCLLTLAESATPVVMDGLVADCVFGYVKKKAAGIFTDIMCNGEAPDFSKLPKTPAPVLTDLTASMIQCAIDKLRSELIGAALDAALRNLGKGMGGKLMTVYNITRDCAYKPYKNWVDGCGDDDDDDQNAQPINSWDPNEMYGYTAPSGSRYIKKGVRQLNYTIEFENSPDFATASAHEVVVTDTLDGRRFDLSSFAPTSLKISDRIVELDGEPSFVRTVDMRPEINAIAQVECDFDARTGIARWYFSSLDPMTMEPTDNPMSGFLAVNTDEGNGIGEVSFNIDLKREFDDGCEIANRASIVFDLNEPILTPTRTNVVDTVAPVSALTGGVVKNDSILTLTWRGEDNRSGLWRYDLYVQDGAGASWRKAAENVTDTLCDFRYYEGMNYGFCVVATDSAGNVERKELAREFTLESFKPGDANGDGKVDALDVTLVVQYYLTKRTPLNLEAADVVRDGVIDALDITRIQQIHLKGNSRIKKRMRRRMYETK